MTEFRFIQPVDTLSMRGNKLFGDPGDFGAADILPLPSVVSGAFRSLMLSESPGALEAFGNGGLADPELVRILGMPERPGAFAVSALFPAQRVGDRIGVLIPPPADLQVVGDSRVDLRVQRMTLMPKPEGALCGYPTDLPFLPVVCQSEPAKPSLGWWLSADGFDAYLKGEAPRAEHLIRTTDLWGAETRVGIGLDGHRRTASDGSLFSVQVTTPRQVEHGPAHAGSAGFLAGFEGTGGRLPASGAIRLGGDGRAALFEAAPKPDLGAPLAIIADTGCFKLVMLTPGLFEDGWLPTGVRANGDGYRFEWSGIKARLACAAVQRAEVVSGWDLAAWRPKDAERAVPAGSVYWFDGLEGEPEALRKLAGQGLWGEGLDNVFRQRRAEGYNRVLVGAW